MLTQETKRHIDAARQVLVGVVPNPSSQIDQITNALIYKFMDDMDQSAIKAGGDPSFFVGDLERYAWTRLMDSRLGNQERMNLYSEALVKFSEAKQLPELFRGIFKTAFLPYRSPEVLGLFLKEIDYFDYSHSEELGNAYEYLLSIMGSQGDAGQFRTPRHIIDFIVAAVNPTKDDKVLDPACGTAGFLVSAYKHILEQHNGKNPDGSTNEEKPLTPDQRRVLMNNFEGYDVDPGMVRISQVNMYLHQFRNPKIFNYNTLSQDERWADKFDVILANPPFMSPKGGVSTHNKFSVQSNRSEVLFADYIMNHLRPKGRAGIIVPEGIIFQSGTAHKQLRKNLVEDGLYAVVSLPSGVFQPYSGVKTSILLFNNELARQRNEILFVKITREGYDLRAQRRPLCNDNGDRPELCPKHSDLPQALEIINAWKDDKKLENKLAVYVEKTKIAENDAYNISGDRYRVATDYTNAKWPMVELESVCDLESGSRQKGGAVDSGVYSIGGEQISEDNSIRFEKMKYITETHFAEMKKGILSKGDVLMVKDGATTGKMGYWGFDYKAAVNEHVFIFRAKRDSIEPKLLFSLLKSQNFQESLQPFIKGIIGGVSLEIKQLKIPLPPLEIQQQIVAELDGYQNIIFGARQVVESWKPQIDIDPAWPIKTLGEIITLQRGYDLPKSQFIDGTVPVVGSNGIIGYHNEEKEKGPGVVTGRSGTIGKVHFIDYEYYWPHNTALFVKEFNGNDRKFIKYLLESIDLKSLGDNVAAVPSLDRKNAHRISVSLPPLNIQKQIVEKIEAERVLVESAKKLIEIYQQKTRDVLSKLWAE